MNPSQHNDLVDDLFARAVALPADQRNVFLSATCNGNGDLLAEVQRLLAAHVRAEQSTDFLASTPETQSHVTNPANDDSLIGKIIGPYEIRRQLGRGGFGEVYLARRTTHFQQTVAIKVVSAVVRDLPRFHLEQQLLADLQHEHIARLFDGGTLPDGRPYIVMEFINGQSITEHCDNLRLTIHERLAIFRQVCTAVSYAHRYSIVHRDIKPANILVVGGRVPFVKLLDFGIAKLLDVDLHRRLVRAQQAFSACSPLVLELVEDSDSSSMTEIGPMTPAYASPEQILGQPVNTSSDIYSLGVVLYELLTGSRPYEFVLYSFEEIRRLVCEYEPLKPSAIVLAPVRDSGWKWDTLRREDADQLHELLQGDLDTIILKALCKTPQERYQSVDALIDDLDRYESCHPIASRSNGPTVSPADSSPEEPSFANTFALLSAAAILIGIVIAGVVMAFGLVIHDYVRHDAMRARTKAENSEIEQRQLAENYKQAANQAEADKLTLAAEASRLWCQLARSDLKKGYRKLGLLRLARALDFAEQSQNASVIDFARVLFLTEWDGRSISKIELNKPAICLDFSPKAARLAVGDEAGQVWEFDPKTNTKRLINSLRGEISAITYSTDGATILLATRSGEIVKLTSATGGISPVHLVDVKRATGMRIDDNGHLLYVLCDDGAIQIADVSSAKVISIIPPTGANGHDSKIEEPWHIGEASVQINGYRYHLCLGAYNLVLTNAPTGRPISPSRPISRGIVLHDLNRIVIQLNDAQFRFFYIPSAMPVMKVGFEAEETNRIFLATEVGGALPSKEVSFPFRVGTSQVGVSFESNSPVKLVSLPDRGNTIEIADAHLMKVLAVSRDSPFVGMIDKGGVVTIRRVQFKTPVTARQIMLACQIREGCSLGNEVGDGGNEDEGRAETAGLRKLDESQIAHLQQELNSLGGMPTDL